MARKKENVTPEVEQPRKIRLDELDDKTRIAAMRLQKGLAARQNLMPFVELMHPDPVAPHDASKSQYVVVPHHQIIADRLERVERGEISRLIIEMPPRHGKSVLVSENFPAWITGRRPDTQIILASYNQRLAEKFGRRYRDKLLMPAYRQLFPHVRVDSGNKSASEIGTENGGYALFLGAGGGLTGHGAHCLILDDIFKGYEEADSQLHRDKIWEWFMSDAKTRVMPGGSIIIMMCVAEGERVLMGNGTWKSIENVAVGDKVIGYEGGKPVRKSVMAVSLQGEDDIINVVSRSCSVKVNKRHPFLVVRGGLKKSAKNQDEINTAREWGLEWVAAGELKPGDSVVTMKSMDSCRGVRPKAFLGGMQMTQDDYWLIGFMFGDGWLINNSGRGVVGFCVADSDKDWLNKKVRELIHARFGVEAKPTNSGYHRVDSRPVGRWMEKMGLTSGARTKHVPDWVFRLRRVDKRAFLKGFFSADGWERTPGAYYVSLCNRELVDDLRLLSRTCGYKTTKIYEHEHIAKAPNSPEPILAKTYQARFYDKHRKFEMNYRYRNQGDFARYFRIEDIESVDPCGRSNVYDITVEGAESFVAEGFVVHNTRWHPDDIVGRILDPENDHYDEQEAAMWTRLKLPALLTHPNSGEKECLPLWPEMEIDGRKFGWSRDYYMSIKRQSARTYWALYQQEPTVEDGDYFKKDWFRFYTPSELPKNLRYYAASDHAVSSKQGADYTVMCVVGVSEEDDIYVIDVDQRRMDAESQVDTMLLAMKRHKPITWWAEKGHITQSIGPFLRKRMLETRTYINVQEMTPVKDKSTRARSLQARMSMGKVYFPKGAHWFRDVEAEMLKFPNGTHDDIVDAISWVGIGLDQMVGPRVHKDPKVIYPKTGTLAWVKWSSDQESKLKERRKAAGGL